MSPPSISKYVYCASLVYFGGVAAFCMAFVGFELASRPHFLSEEAFRCAFFKGLFLLTVLMTIASSTSAGVLWKNSSLILRIAFVGSSLLFLGLCVFNLYALAFCGG